MDTACRSQPRCECLAAEEERSASREVMGNSVHSGDARFNSENTESPEESLGVRCPLMGSRLLGEVAADGFLEVPPELLTRV